MAYFSQSELWFVMAICAENVTNSPYPTRETAFAAFSCASSNVNVLGMKINMKYLSVAETAGKWGVSERSVRNYCAGGRIDGAFLTGKTWNIPENAVKSGRKNANIKAPETLLEILTDEKKVQRKGLSYRYNSYRTRQI